MFGKKRRDRERMFKHEVWKAVHLLQWSVEELSNGNTEQAKFILDEVRKAKDGIWDNS